MGGGTSTCSLRAGDAGSAELRCRELVGGGGNFPGTPPTIPLLQQPCTTFDLGISIDDRWYDLIISKLKDLAEFQEKKAKINATGRTRLVDDGSAALVDPKGKAKAKAGQKGKGKGKEVPQEEPSSQ